MSNTVIVQRIWPDGDILNVQVEADTAYPDALDQARAAAVRGFAEALNIAQRYDAAEAVPDTEPGD